MPYTASDAGRSSIPEPTLLPISVEVVVARPRLRRGPARVGMRGGLWIFRQTS